MGSTIALCVIAQIPFSAHLEGKKTNSGVEGVLARQLGDWWPEFEPTVAYSRALVNGIVEPVTDLAEWRSIPRALRTSIRSRGEGRRWARRFDQEAWEIAIMTVHGLAHGDVELYETGEQVGTKTPLTGTLMVYEQELADAGITLSAFAQARDGDVMAAAASWVRVADKHDRQFASKATASRHSRKTPSHR